MNKVLVVGLDALDPKLVEAWLPDLPTLQRLIKSGISGPLQSIIQPVTPAAWTAMISGHNQGYFGFTDYFYRPTSGYTPQFVHSGAIRCATIDQQLAAAGRRSVMIGVPVSYPPVAAAGDVSVSCFMAPSLNRSITNPPELQKEILAATSQPYLLDVTVENGSSPYLDELADQLIEFDQQRFDIALHLMKTRQWEMLFLVCMGTDRVGHYFMRYQDPEHRLYPGKTPYADNIRKHYQYCDQRLGELLQAAGNDTTVIVVSDHGIQRLDGKVFLNRWLIENGYLRLNKKPDKPLPIQSADIDWAHTQAWAMGYGGQIYINVEGREPNGCVPVHQVNELCQEISAGLSRLNDPEGKALQVDSFFGSDLFSGPYAENCPDLCVQFRDLKYLVSNRVDSGPLVAPTLIDDVDNASHAREGVFIMAGPEIPAVGHFSGLHILDIAPTILSLLEVPIPNLEGQPVHWAIQNKSPYDESDKLSLTSRLQKLYLD